MSEPGTGQAAPSPRTEEFFGRIRTLRAILNIHPGSGGERDRLRIALAVGEAFLCTGDLSGTSPAAARRLQRRLVDEVAVEWQTYTALVGLGTACDELPEEIRCAEERKLRNWDPLRLHHKSGGPHQPCWLIQRVIHLLREGEDRHATRSDELKRVHHR